MSVRDYYIHDSSDLNDDLVEWDPPPVEVEVKQQPIITGHISDHWSDPEETQPRIHR